MIEIKVVYFLFLVVDLFRGLLCLNGVYTCEKVQIGTKKVNVYVSLLHYSFALIWDLIINTIIQSIVFVF